MFDANFHALSPERGKCIATSLAAPPPSPLPPPPSNRYGQHHVIRHYSWPFIGVHMPLGFDVRARSPARRQLVIVVLRDSRLFLAFIKLLLNSIWGYRSAHKTEGMRQRNKKTAKQICYKVASKANTHTHARTLSHTHPHTHIRSRTHTLCSIKLLRSRSVHRAASASCGAHNTV